MSLTPEQEVTELIAGLADHRKYHQLEYYEPYE